MSDNIQTNISTSVENVNVFVTPATSTKINVMGGFGPINNIETNVIASTNTIDVTLTDTSATNILIEHIYPTGPVGPQGPVGPMGQSVWGTISGTLSAQSDLWSLLSTAGIQTLYYDESAQLLSISRGNTITLSSLKDISLYSVIDYLSTNYVYISGLTINDNLSVGGESYFDGPVTLLDTLSVQGNFFTEGLATFSDNLSVAKDLYVDGTLYTQNTAIVLGTYFTNIGDGTNTNFNITHNLGSQDVHVVVRDLQTNLLAFPAIQPIDANSVNISFNFIPLLTSYNVSIFAGVPSNKISAYRQDVRFLPRPIANTFYVSVSGNDNNSGTEISFPLRTIKKACELAHNARVLSRNNPNIKYTIFVGTGDFLEENPIYVAPNTSIIGDNLRRVNVIPKNKQYDLFWVDNSTYVWGFTFRGHLAPGAVFAFPNLKVPTLTAIALSALEVPYVSPGVYKWRRPYITTSPYIQGSSSIASGENGIPAGCGMRVDGSLAEGFLRSMVLDSYTQFNEGGRGIEIINNGYAQLVSIFTICCTEGMVCLSGGSCSITNSNCSFGLSGLVAAGKSPLPVLTGSLVNFTANPEDPFATTTLIVSGVEGTQIFPDSDYYPSLLNIPGVNLDTRKIAYAPYDGLVFDVNEGPDLYTIQGTPLSSSPGSFTINTLERINNSVLAPGTKIRFYIRSTIYASAHTFEFVGTGTRLRNAVPALGGVSTPETEVVFNEGGAVFYTSTNHTGDFSIGEEFRVVQSTGTIEGDTFRRSILTLVTPLTLALE